ncbi:MAG: ATP-binding protein [Chloroflexi bacterium]|nr:ATP-binding protein [Chloroflexota bacterium]
MPYLGIFLENSLHITLLPQIEHMKNMSDCVYPCPCGYHGDSLKPCSRAHALVTKYQKRISGPLLDRINTGCHIEVPRVDHEKLIGDRVGESSEMIRARVQAARDIQKQRFVNGKAKDIISNADMRIGEIRQFCQLQAEGGALTVRLALRLTVSKCQSLMRAAMSQLQLSARAYHCIPKLARTIADLAGSENIQSTRLAEVLHLWSLEDHDVMNTFFEHDIRFINKQTLNQFYFLLT